MPAVSIYDPFADVFPTLFKGVFDDSAPVNARRRVSGFAVDIHEDEKSYSLVANLPGLSKEQINVEIDGNQVIISAQTHFENDTKPAEGSAPGRRLLRSERYTGSFARAFTLPGEIDEGQSNAKYDNGVLTLNLPKKTQVSAKRLTIS